MVTRYFLFFCYLFASFVSAQIPVPGHAGSISNGEGATFLGSATSVYVAGNYAYVASYGSNVLEIIDVTNPATPVPRGKFPVDSPRSVYVSGNYAYVASAGNALEIINIANPSLPVLNARLTSGTNGALLDGPFSVFVSGNFAYVASYNSDALEIVDITNPASPVHRGSITNGTDGALLNNPWSVYVSGNYAYIVSYDVNALEIVDISNPSAPVHKGSLMHGVGGALLDGPTSVYVSGNYAYISSYNSNALEIVDISNPTSPIHEGSLSNGSAGALLDQPWSVFVSGNYAYVTSFNSNALEIVDVTDPSNPVHFSSISNGTDGALLNNPYAVYLSGDYAYVTSAGSNALQIIDVSNPAAPFNKGNLIGGISGALLHNPTSVVVSGNYAYVASAGSNALEIVDVTNPAAPFHKGSLTHGTGGALLDGPRSVYVSGHYAYVVSTGGYSLEIVDVANPAVPVHKGSLIHGTGGALLGLPYSVFVSGNYAYVASFGSDALEIVDVTNPTAPVHKGSLTDGTGGALLAGPLSVFVSGNYAYVASSSSNALEIVNVTNPAAPVHAGSFTIDAPVSVYVSGGYAYVASYGNNSLEILNVTNPNTPIHEGSISNGTGGALLDDPQSVYVSGDYAYVASAVSNALEIVDVTNPATPVHKSSLANGTGGALLNGPLSVYVSGNYAYVASYYSSALEIISLFYPIAPIANSGSLVGQSTFSANWSSVGNASGYFIDVSTDNFSTFVSGFNNAAQSGTSITVTGLSPGTTYQYRVRASNANGVSDNSSIVSVTTLPATPVATAATSITQTSFTANWDLTLGATVYILDVAEDAGFNSLLSSYNFLVTTNNSVSVTDLVPGNTYYYRVRAKGGSGGGTTPFSNTISQATIPTEPLAPTNLTFTSFSTNSLNGSFTSSLANGYILLQRSGASPTGTPVDGITYTVGNIIGDGTVVAVGAATTFSASGLTANTVYNYDVIAYNGSGNIINYNTTTRLEGSRTTLQTEPTAQSTNITFTNVTTASLSGSFTAASGAPSGYLVLHKQGSPPTGAPVDGNIYTGGQSIGDGLVVSVSNTTLFADAGLSAGTIYHYAIFSYNGSGEAINYRAASPASASFITITTPPATSAATGAQQTSFTANWSTPTGAASYLLDVSDNNFSTLLPNYSAKPVSSTSESVTGLTPGVIYQYRVRAVNASGSSDYSNATSQITAPQTPTANAASVIRTNDFKAVWTNVLGETEYRLDVSLNNFTTYLNGYENKLIPADLAEETVTGLSPSTQYQYRVKAVNAAGPSGYSNVVTVTTLAGGGNTPLTIGNISFLDESDGLTPISVSVPITGGINSISAVVHYRGMMANAFTPLNMANTTGNTFQATIPTSALDELGLEFYIVATDGAESPTSAKNYVYRSFESTQASKIPTINKFGGKLETYQIISIPFQLEDNLIASIFEPSLGAYDKTKWRLVRFQNGKNTDYQAGLTRINQGESYWFNAVKPVEVKPGNGTAPKYNQSKPFMLKLAKGWNQIATPFPFAIDWDDILEANGNPTGIGNYKIYVPNSLSFVESNSLQPYSGGFVFADEAKDLSLPVILKNSSGGRKRTRQMGSDIGADEWLLPITLTQGNAINPMGGIGMHSRAKSGKDDFDDITLPRFVNYLEFNSYHDEFVAPRFSRDVVPTVAEYEWEISIESNFNEGDITLDWASVNFGNNNAQLILFDPVNDLMLDMKQIKNYSLPPSAKQTLRLLYFRERKLDFNNALHLGLPFPNPATGEVSFLLFDTAKARLEIIDLFGRPVYQADFALNSKQLNTIQWSGESLNSQRVSSGLYLYKLTTVSAGTSKTSQGRIIIH